MMKLKLSPQWKSVITGEAQNMIVEHLNAIDPWDITKDKIKPGMICKAVGKLAHYGRYTLSDYFVIITEFDEDDDEVFYKGIFGIRSYVSAKFNNFKSNYKVIYDPSEEV